MHSTYSCIYFDLQALEADLRAYLEKATGKPVYTQVDEITTKIRVRGTFMEELCQFLLQKGL